MTHTGRIAQAAVGIGPAVHIVFNLKHRVCFGVIVLGIRKSTHETRCAPQTAQRISGSERVALAFGESAGLFEMAQRFFEVAAEAIRSAHGPDNKAFPVIHPRLTIAGSRLGQIRQGPLRIPLSADAQADTGQTLRLPFYISQAASQVAGPFIGAFGEPEFPLHPQAIANTKVGIEFAFSQVCGFCRLTRLTVERQRFGKATLLAGAFALLKQGRRCLDRSWRHRNRRGDFRTTPPLFDWI